MKSGIKRHVPPSRFLCNRSVQLGFSLIELMAVVGIVLVLAAIAIPNLASAIRGIRLSESSSSYANLLQQARIRAIRDNQYYMVRTGNLPTGEPIAFVDLKNSSNFDPGDPVVVFQSGIVWQPTASAPSLNNLELKFLPNGSQGTVNTGNGPTFGTRGLPCTPSGTGTCPYLTAPLFLPTSYVTVLQNTQSGKWQAITITPGARIQRWAYDGTSTWSPIS